MKNWYGLLGLLSLVGLIGVFTQERSFLAFFSFAVDFSFFGVQPDEMFREQIRRSAAWGFFSGMGISGLVTLAGALFVAPHQALVQGTIWGWAAAVAVFSLSSAYFSFRESWGMDRA